MTPQRYISLRITPDNIDQYMLSARLMGVQGGGILTNTYRARKRSYDDELRWHHFRQYPLPADEYLDVVRKAMYQFLCDPRVFRQ